jgi:branched-chain amino acid transport system substrate-binding protein
MQNKTSPILIVLVVFSIVSIAIIIYGVSNSTTSPPIVEDNPKYNYTFGIITAYTEDIQKNSFIAESAIAEINQYCDDNNYPFRFGIKVVSAEGMAPTAIEKTQAFKESGVNLIIGPPWSSMFCAVRNYANENNMIVISPSSTSPLLAMDDNGFRLAIHDGKTSQILAELLAVKDSKAIVCISRNDSWANAVWMELLYDYEGEAVKIDYPSESTSFHPYLLNASQTLQKFNDTNKYDQVSILALCFDELPTILEESTEYPVLNDVSWLAANMDVKWNWTLSSIDIASSVNLTSFSPVIPSSDKFADLNNEFQRKFGEELGFYDANIYDCCWLFALSVIEAGSNNAVELKPVLIGIAEDYIGVTGLCRFDCYGDRAAATYSIYQYKPYGDTIQIVENDRWQIDFHEGYYREGVH